MQSSLVLPSEIAVQHPGTCQPDWTAEAMLHHTGEIVLDTFLVHTESGETPRGEEFEGCLLRALPARTSHRRQTLRDVLLLALERIRYSSAWHARCSARRDAAAFPTQAQSGGSHIQPIVRHGAAVGPDNSIYQPHLLVCRVTLHNAA